ncbi:hypothetical protein ACWGQ2_04065 [Arthrobacter sp. NPDC055585]
MSHIRAAAASVRGAPVPLPPVNGYRRIARGAAAAVVVLLLAGCTPADPVDDLEPGLTLSSFTESLSRLDLEIYGGAAGAGGREENVQIEVPLGRDGLGVSGLCRGAEGIALVTLNAEGPFELQCTEGGDEQELTDSLPLEGIRLLITVEGAPDGAVWAVAATSAR